MARIIAAAFGLFSWLLATLFSLLYPMPDSLAQGSLAVDWRWAWGLVAAGLLAWATWLFWKPGAGKGQGGGRLTYGMRILASSVVQVALAILAATWIHRDFASLLFQAIAIHYALFLDASPRYTSRRWLSFSGYLFAFTMVLVLFFLAWIAIMGYAIASRTEPRWIPSLGYNALNLAICAFLVIANLNLRTGSRREVAVRGCGLYLDNLDILPLFSPAARPLALRFVSMARGGTLTCREARRVAGMEDCAEECPKATSCPGYRYMYNRIHEVGKIFSALKMGTVTSPVERRDILDEGWGFVADASVRVIPSAGD